MLRNKRNAKECLIAQPPQSVPPESLNSTCVHISEDTFEALSTF